MSAAFEIWRGSRIDCDVAITTHQAEVGFTITKTIVPFFTGRSVGKQE
jgi:hypothetical protein